MNEEQANQLIDILNEIKNKLDVVIPRDAHEKKQIQFNQRFKDKIRLKLFPTFTQEHKKTLFAIEREITEELK